MANILKGNQKKLYLGNLSARRDWGFAPEYVEMMWLMLQQETPDDYVVGTGKSYTVREFVDKAFSYMGVRLEWKGEGPEETGAVRSSTWEHLTPGDYPCPGRFPRISSNRSRGPSGRHQKARQKLGWEPRMTFEELVKIMMDCDARSLGLEAACEGLAASRCKGFDYTNHDFSMHEQIREH